MFGICFLSASLPRFDFFITDENEGRGTVGELTSTLKETTLL